MDKACKRCGEVKPADGYYRNRLVCKGCDGKTNKEYRLRHREESIAYLRQYRKDHPGLHLKYRLANPEKYKEYDKMRQAALRDEALAHYGGKCACCGEAHREFLAIDHINGGGNKHRRDNRLNSGISFTRWLKKNGYPDGFRVLCHNCNSALGYYGYCPHNNE